MNNLTTNATFKGFPVITGTFNNFQYNSRHLDNNLRLLISMTDRHNKVLAFRMDIRLPQNKQIDNPYDAINKLMSSYTNNLSRRGLDPAYVVKTEQQSSENPHFHCQILVDGNKVLNYRKLIEICERLLELQLNLPAGASKGLIDYCDNYKNGIMIRRGSIHYQEQFDNCFKQMSYLAKEKKDDVIPAGTRKISYSRINRKRCRNTD